MEIANETPRYTDNESFWSLFEIKQAPADGHCLLHSFVACVNSQLYGYAHYDLADVIVAIHKETMANIAEYAAYFRNENSATLLRDMEKYLYQKHYNTRFGDLVPMILANAFQLNLILLKECVNDSYMQTVKCQSPDTRRYIALQKCPDHYNGIVKKQSTPVVGIRHEGGLCK